MALNGYEKSLEEFTKSELVEIAKTYTVYYQTSTGAGSITGYQNLEKQKLINLIKSDRDYQNARPKSRVEILKSKTQEVKNPEELMLIILDIFRDVVVIPEVGKFYTFVYNAKTPGLWYDQHPLIACTEIKNWGFIGINFHWRKYRNYTWNEVAGKSGQLHIINYEELDELLAIPYAKFLLNK
jgi:hypothetical protein